MSAKIAIIIGAGPAGLTAAYELLQKTDIKPILFESSGELGGLSRTVNYKGNRMDIGGHRFFSKSDRVMQWWLDKLPMQAPAGQTDGDAVPITYHQQTRDVAPAAEGPDPEKTDLVMLVRRRLSRILYRRKFFDYPVSLNLNTITNLGLLSIIKIGLSYVAARLFPIKPEKSLEDFFTNRFGRELYLTFFKDYTEKVWGVPCSAIKPEWGVQRVKGLSVSKAILHALTSMVRRDRSITQQGIETSLIEQFLYPKFGPGQMWEEVARRVVAAGGEIYFNSNVLRLDRRNGGVTSAVVQDSATGETRAWDADYFFSSMPVKDLIEGMHASQPVPAEVLGVARGLVYRDFITVGLLLRRLKPRDRDGEPIRDNWIYVQEADVKVGRLQIFNNWSPYMVRDAGSVWIGLEYFCNEGDEMWRMPDDAFIRFAVSELVKIGLIDEADVLDGTRIRVPKTYPAYTGLYEQFDTVRAYVDQFPNLFLIGRNGMHRYNNQDHSMLTAMTAVENIVNGVTTKDNIWAVNVEQEYHETKASPSPRGA
jgi:protoporphyrinogen oxidase